MYVCMSVMKLQVIVFDPVSFFFVENMFFWTMGKKFFFSVFRNFNFGRFQGLLKFFFFSFFLFVFVLDTSRPIRPTNKMFGLQAQCDIERKQLLGHLETFIFWRHFFVFPPRYLCTGQTPHSTHKRNFQHRCHIIGPRLDRLA